MKSPNIYTASKLLTGEGEALRLRSFTRWMSRDLTQAAVDFCRNIGLVPVYTECSPDHRVRYLFWSLPQEALIEVRSGRTKGQFEEFDRANQERGMELLSLHINESDTYSAVWISSGHLEIGKNFLKAFGITFAERHEA